jgi:hypothetical protein
MYCNMIKKSNNTIKLNNMIIDDVYYIMNILDDTTNKLIIKKSEFTINGSNEIASVISNYNIR